jgi:aconitate hydratase
VTVTARADDGSEKTFEATVRLDTPNEVTYFINSGILQTVLRKLKR